jgi:hypothetical protein
MAAFESIERKSPGYRDVAQLMAQAQAGLRQESLYNEARDHLAAAQKRIEEIQDADPNFPDSSGIFDTFHHSSQVTEESVQAPTQAPISTSIGEEAPILTQESSVDESQGLKKYLSKVGVTLIQQSAILMILLGSNYLPYSYYDLPVFLAIPCVIGLDLWIHKRTGWMIPETTRWYSWRTRGLLAGSVLSLLLYFYSGYWSIFSLTAPATLLILLATSWLQQRNPSRELGVRLIRLFILASANVAYMGLWIDILTDLFDLEYLYLGVAWVAFGMVIAIITESALFIIHLRTRR